MSVQLETCPIHSETKRYTMNNELLGRHIAHTQQKRKSMADRTGYFPKITKNSQQEKQNWPNRKN